ncbi:M20 family peptidase [Pseudoflavonifractor sp. 60]|uniref:M20 family metallopeptidase n=1 Tax=Pseudoflavonifractor sp. 60 TaxID=2304576 RepID=UPI00136E4A61|nr:M20/M25/M40 family metallo-hydrolase [Pseudoflavonifractor sp. 60]NBI67922.1 M20 family peptidase [Pseudoflavonifractor sp. 60]
MFTAKEVHSAVENAKQEIIDCLVELLQTPSMTGEEVPVSKVFCKWIERAGLEPQIHGISEEHPNVLAEWFGSQPGKRFIFNGHMDTFPPTEGDPGIYGPFSGKVTDTHIYGRGAADMKGGDAAALMAVTILKRMGFDPKGSILLSYMCDEEIGGRYGVKWLVKQELLNGDFGICMEPTRGHILVGHSGIYRAWITYTASAESSSREHTSKNALEKSVIAINALHAHRDVVRGRKDPHYDCASLSVTTLHAGNATNVHAAQSKFSIDYRLVPGQTHEQVEAEIRGLLDALKENDTEMDYTIETISDRPVLDIPEDSDVVKACCTAYEEVTGRPAQLLRRHGGSDAATIFGHNGILMPNWGAGDEYNEGTKPNEKIVITDYLQSVEYYMLTLIKLMG